jgi:uncharacterized Zn finger protein (UPF0148 family)
MTSPLIYATGPLPPPPATRPRATQPQDTTCATRGCTHDRADGSLFCAAHAEPLRRVREHLARQSRRDQRRIMRSSRSETWDFDDNETPTEGSP